MWNSDCVAYTYFVKWSSHNIKYYGVRFAKNCHPDDLWVTYFTSSKKVKRFREEHGEPDVVEIRRTFSSKSAARNWETKVIQRLGLVKSIEWLNQTDHTGKFFWQGKRGSQSEDHRAKLSKSHRGLKQSDETIAKRVAKITGMKRPGSRPDVAIFKQNQVVSQETRERMSLAKKSDPDNVNRVSRAGKASAAARAKDPEYKARQSEKMKAIWEERRRLKALGN